MDRFDFVFAGGGLAGLSLAHRLTTGPFSAARIAIVDPERKGDNDRTWCYWSSTPGPFDSVVSSRWSGLAFRSRFATLDLDISPYEYRMIRGEDFYRAVLSDLEAAPGVEFIRSTVTSIRDGDAFARVETETGAAEASWVFDSRFDPAEYETRRGGHHYLKQHFEGWEIVTERDVFDPGRFTMFDFRTPQCGEMRFLYVLPFAANRALIEFTLFSATLLSDQEYASAVERYIDDVIAPGAYRVVDREHGVIPMTDEPQPRRLGNRVMAIGTKGGRVKASTGYAFRRIQQDSQRIAESLEVHGHPWDVPRQSPWTATLDTLLLQIMYRRGGLSEEVFSRLFSRNPVGRLFRFLDEETAPVETIKLMATVPWGPFIAAWFRTKILGKV